jgi:hypothetical protein
LHGLDCLLLSGLHSTTRAVPSINAVTSNDDDDDDDDGDDDNDDKVNTLLYMLMMSRPHNNQGLVWYSY